MRRSISIIRCVLAGTAIGIASCHQSSPPQVAVAPAAAEEPAPIRPKAAVGLKNVDEAIARSNDSIRDGGTFAFPEDAGGKALAKSLAPASPKPMPAGGPPMRKERQLPAFLESPAPPGPDVSGSLPRLPLPLARDVRPTPLPDRVPPDIGGTIAQLPPRAEFPTGPLARQDSRDIAKPADLPVLSPRPVIDRAPLTDPTIEFTAQSAISPTLPLRTQPTGFIRFNLPDPFEHADAAKPRTPIVENPNRSLPSLPPPRGPG
jgi:hypothetical protein